ncbi:MAG: hypothetical protein MUF00_06690 [Gemmatimonadaceae bacterium]|nr:hypothetical protein [Gemmatimonadaceae bacterium]
MGAFETRITELRAQRRQLFPALPAATAARLDECIDRWGVQRDAALEQLLFLASTVEVLGNGLPVEWTRAVNRTRTELRVLFAERVKDVVLDAPSQLWWFQQYCTEDEMFAGLLTLRSPERLQELYAHQVRLGRTIGELRDKWTWLLETKRAVRTPEMQLIDQMDRDIRDAMEKIDLRWREMLLSMSKVPDHTRAMLQKVATALKISDEKPGNRAAAEEAAKKTIEAITNVELPEGAGEAVKTTAAGVDMTATMFQSILGAHVERIRTYKALLARQRGSVLRLFTEHREAALRYRREQGLEKAREWSADAVNLVSAWAGKLATPGQKTDGLAFASLLIATINKLVQHTETWDGDFRREFAGVFVDALSTSTIEQLAERYLFEQQVAKTMSVPVATRIEDMARLLPAAVNEAADQAFAPLLAPQAAAPAEIQALLTGKHAAFRAYMTRVLADRVNVLLGNAYRLRDVFRPSQIASDFDRSELSSDLR